MYTFLEIKEKCRRKDYLKNNSLHWFSSRFSIYFSYVFINLGLSADFVTFIFFIIGFAGALLFSFNSFCCFLIGYLLYRLHIIIDMSDGDVARFNKSYSVRGVYWDSVIHSVLNPLYYISCCFSFYFYSENEQFLFIAPFLGLSSSLLMSVKNNYDKALFKNNAENVVLDNKIKNNLKFKIFNFISEIVSIEGFLFFTLLIQYFQISNFMLLFIYIYLVLNIIVSLVKFLLLSYKGHYPKRN